MGRPSGVWPRAASIRLNRATFDGILASPLSELNQVPLQQIMNRFGMFRMGDENPHSGPLDKNVVLFFGDP